MDDSVRLFKEEQRRLATVSSPAAALKRQLITGLANLITFGAIINALITALDYLPRNPDNSMKFIYYGPVLLALACGAALLLRGGVLDRLRLRPVLWGLVVMAVIAVPAGLIDAVFTKAVNH